MKSSASIFFQCLLCALLLVFCLTVGYRKSNRAVQASSIGFSKSANDTFTQLAQKLYRVACDE